jgi:hypothetical protein
MAYPTVSAPYGFKPVNRIDGMPYAGQTRLIPIASDYNTAIYNGDLVKLVTGGTAELFTGADDGVMVGVCVGVQYVNSLSQFTPAQYYPGTSVTNAYAIVVDDPMVAFKTAVTNDSSVMGTAARAAVGSNMSVVLGAGDAATGDSGQSAEAGTEATTAGLPLRVIDVVTETATGADAFVEIIVKMNTHQYNSTTGV